LREPVAATLLAEHRTISGACPLVTLDQIEPAVTVSADILLAPRNAGLSQTSAPGSGGGMTDAGAGLNSEPELAPAKRKRLLISRRLSLNNLNRVAVELIRLALFELAELWKKDVHLIDRNSNCETFLAGAFHLADVSANIFLYSLFLFCHIRITSIL
jgi:hypothetical protein